MRSTSLEVPVEDMLVVDGLSKRLTGIHDARYTPTVSLMARFRARWEGGAFAGAGGDISGDDTDADDDVDDDEEEDEEAQIGESEPSLRDVSFTVRSGEAVGIVGDPESVALLARVLGRMTDPGSGRFSFRGRMGLSFGLATALSREEDSSPPRVMKLLSALANIPRARRRAWVAEGLALVGGGVPPNRWEFSEKSLRRRLATAASLDPTADVLVVERVPDHADGEFRERCLLRLRERLDAGAAAVLPCPDLDAIASVCDRVVWLEAGSVAAVGPTRAVLEDFRSGLRDEDRAEAAIPSFNALVAIHDAAVSFSGNGDGEGDASGREHVTVRAALETARPDTFVTCRARLWGPRVLALVQREPERLVSPGPYVASLQADAGSLVPGEYRLRVEVVAFEAGGSQSVAVRSVTRPARLGRDSDRDGGRIEGEMAVELPLLDWSIISDPATERP